MTNCNTITVIIEGGLFLVITILSHVHVAWAIMISKFQFPEVEFVVGSCPVNPFTPKSA